MPGPLRVNLSWHMQQPADVDFQLIRNGQIFRDSDAPLDFTVVAEDVLMPRSFDGPVIAPFAFSGTIDGVRFVGTGAFERPAVFVLITHSPQMPCRFSWVIVLRLPCLNRARSCWRAQGSDYSGAARENISARINGRRLIKLGDVRGWMQSAEASGRPNGPVA
jgi:hypothetical protein